MGLLDRTGRAGGKTGIGGGIGGTCVGARLPARPLDKAQIQLSYATLRKDEGARNAALSELARLAPHDTGALLGWRDPAASAELSGGLRAVSSRALRSIPGTSSALNSLGYTEGESGDLEAAKKTFEVYGQQPNQAINALDSLGEVYFMNGRFAEAEKYFAQESARDPNFLKGAPLMKAAYARWLGGDSPGADVLMQKYLAFLATQNDPLAAWRNAVWLYATGRREQAMAALAKAPPTKPLPWTASGQYGMGKLTFQTISINSGPLPKQRNSVRGRSAPYSLRGGAGESWQDRRGSRIAEAVARARSCIG